MARLGDPQAKVNNMRDGGSSLEMPAPPTGSSLEVSAPARELRQPVEVRLLSFGLSLNA